MSRIDETNKGKRVNLIHTNDPYTRLKPGIKGTYQNVMLQTDGHQHSIQWDDGSTLMMIEGVDSFEFLEVVSTLSDKCRFGKKGFPHCHCNDCLGAIIQYAEFKKDKVYHYKGEEVTINSFCPLPSCCEIFIQGEREPAFCKWLTLEEARGALT